MKITKENKKEASGGKPPEWVGFEDQTGLWAGLFILFGMIHADQHANEFAHDLAMMVVKAL